MADSVADIASASVVAATGDLSPAERKLLFEGMEKSLPELWARCYPRVYREPRSGVYYSPKEPSRSMFSVAVKYLHGLIGESERYEFCTFSHIARFRNPTFYLSSDMAAAIRQTVPPQEIDWFSAPLPFEAAFFVLPKGALAHPTDGGIPWAGYARLKPGEMLKSPIAPEVEYGSLNGGFMLIAASMGGHIYHFNLPQDVYGSGFKVPDMERFIDDHKDVYHGTGFDLGRDMRLDARDHALLASVSHYVFGSLLLMAERPDLLTPAALDKRIARKGERPVEFWTPNILGEHYKIRRDPGPAGGGTHASPRFHWVRGSYRRQPFGPGRELRKTMWIEPYMRGV